MFPMTARCRHFHSLIAKHLSGYPIAPCHCRRACGVPAPIHITRTCAAACCAAFCKATHGSVRWHGLYNYGLYSYGSVRWHGLYSYGLYSYGSVRWHGRAPITKMRPMMTEMVRQPPGCQGQSQLHSCVLVAGNHSKLAAIPTA